MILYPISFQVFKIIYEKGCLDVLEEKIVSNVATVGGVGIGIAFIQVCLAICPLFKRK